MTATSNDVKTRVLQAINIVELIGQTVKLRRRGGKYVGLCPFHQEKTPSFTVDPTRQFFHCFGCKAGGNAIDFVMRRDRLQFVEALQFLARQLGIELPKAGGDNKNASQRLMLLEVLSAACMFFENTLAHPQLGAAARQYLAQRGFTADSIRKFQIGLAPNGWDCLLKSPVMKKYTPQQLVMAGLAKAREGGDGFYDVFRNRIIFPIRDEQGRVIAFGGRAMPGAEDPSAVSGPVPAKYLNSPETPLFSKSRCIFGLDLARNRIVQTRTAAVVEGYTDVVMAHQCGACNVVSVLGTALTEQHVATLRRYADKIVLLFDADQAGDQAVNRSIELFLTQPVEIAIATMPSGLDPDEYLLSNGLEAFEKLLNNEAQDPLEFKWRIIRSRYGSSPSITEQQRIVDEYLSGLAAAREVARQGALGGQLDPIRWGLVLQRLSRLTGIAVSDLNRKFDFRRTVRQRIQVQEQPQGKVSAAVPLNARLRAERWILGVLLENPQRWPTVQRFVQPENFSDIQCRKIADIYWRQQQEMGQVSFSELLSDLDEPELKDLAVSVLEEVQEMGNLEQTLQDALGYLRESCRRQAERQKMPQDEVELLRKLQEQARQPDIRRTAT